jgi:uncharacterized lipoprotein YbaY
MAGTTISGQIRFDDSAPAFRNATVRVILEDVTRADAPAREVARLEIPSYSHAPGEPPLEFSLEPLTPLDPRARYDLRVHVDLGSGGKKEVGDQITMQSYPVATQGYPRTATVNLRRID